MSKKTINPEATELELNESGFMFRMGFRFSVEDYDGRTRYYTNKNYANRDAKLYGTKVVII